MTNDLLEELENGEPREDGQPVTASAPLPPAGEPQPGAAPEEPEEKTVFAPSMWERRREEKAARAASSPEDTAAYRAEKEARRQEKEAEKEAKKLELKIAQEQRKAQEEERRREAKARDEERREQSRQREEENRQRRREEKAKQATVRRVGTMTLGVALIAIGVAILAYMINPGFDIRIVAYLAPVILISLGVEILIRQFFSKDRTYKYDFASGIICIFLVIGSFCVSLVPYLVYYISPERFVSEEQLLEVEREKMYQALRGDQRVRDYYVGGGISGDLAAARKDENGNWAYRLNYLYGNIYLMDSCADEAEFARICRELLDKIEAQDSDIVRDSSRNSFAISFDCGDNEEGISYHLSVSNRLQMEMDAQNLAKLVSVTYSKPTRENGWLPAGYDEILNTYGQPYADHFAQLMEHVDTETASNYYSLIMDGDYPIEVAESYYRSYMDDEDEGPAAEVLDGDEEGNSSEEVQSPEERSESQSEPLPGPEAAESAEAPVEAAPSAA